MDVGGSFRRRQLACVGLNVYRCNDLREYDESALTTTIPMGEWMHRRGEVLDGLA